MTAQQWMVQKIQNLNVNADGDVLFGRGFTKAVDHRKEDSLKKNLDTTLHLKYQKKTGKHEKTVFTQTVPTKARLKYIKTLTTLT